MASRIRTHLLLPALHGLETDTSAWSTATWSPPVDVYEMADAILIQVEAPGLRLQNMRLHFEPGELTVEGQRDRPELPGPARAARVEMNYGQFRRRFALPPDADGDGIAASYDLGILQIRVPRRQQLAPAVRRIDID